MRYTLSKQASDRLDWIVLWCALVISNKCSVLTCPRGSFSSGSSKLMCAFSDGLWNCAGFPTCWLCTLIDMTNQSIVGPPSPQTVCVGRLCAVHCDPMKGRCSAQCHLLPKVNQLGSPTDCILPFHLFNNQEKLAFIFLIVSWKENQP